MKFFIEMRESVINYKFYDDIRKSRYGRVFSYLALLLLIVYTLSGVKSFIYMNQAVEMAGDYVKNKTPEFSIENGKLNWSGEPLQYLVRENGNLVAIDVNRTLTKEVLDSENSIYFVIRDESVLVKNTTSSQELFYKDIDLKLNKADVLNFLAGGKTIIILMIVIAFPFYFAVKLLNVVLLAIAATIVCSFMKLRLPWKENFIISGYALTLPLLIGLLFNLAGTPLPGTIYWLISVLYVIMALRIIKGTEERIAVDAIRLAEVNEARRIDEEVTRRLSAEKPEEYEVTESTESIESMEMNKSENTIVNEADEKKENGKENGIE